MTQTGLQQTVGRLALCRLAPLSMDSFTVWTLTLKVFCWRMETKNILLAFGSIFQNRDESIKVTKVGVKTQKIKLLICLQIKQRKCRSLGGTHHLQTKTNKKNVKMSTGCGGWIQTRSDTEHDKVKSNRRKTRRWENPRSLFNEADDSMSIMMRSKRFKVELLCLSEAGCVSQSGI